MPVTFTYEVSDSVIAAYKSIEGKSEDALIQYMTFTLEGRMNDFIKRNNENTTKQVSDALSEQEPETVSNLLDVTKALIADPEALSTVMSMLSDPETLTAVKTTLSEKMESSIKLSEESLKG